MKVKKYKYKLPILLILLSLILNEYTLLYLDKNPPLSLHIVYFIRIFDLFCILLALISIFYANVKIKTINFSLNHNIILKLKKIIFTLVLYLMFFIFLDILIGFFGFGYSNNFKEENFQRTPSTYDYFSGKPNVLDHNHLGFRGLFVEKENLKNNEITIAFFGGSTGYNGKPPIIDIIGKKIGKTFNVKSYNFSSISSNHTQHIHRLIKYIKRFKFDIVIFYGGGNETMQYEVYDPRIGYPFNYFYRSELSSFKKLLIENSNILGEIDKHTKIISGLNRLVIENKSPNRHKEIISKYESDLNLASEITKKIGEPNFCQSPIFVSVSQPGNPITENTKKLWEKYKIFNKTRSKDIMHKHLDLSYMSDLFEYKDTIHFKNQSSREIIASKIYKYLVPLITNCK